jgi:eukaryotic-like serine/threonine-protein kinase
LTDEDKSSVVPGRVLGKYEVKRRLGSGGMGGVYEARHVDLDKPVAIKILDKKLAKNKVYLERFLREGRIAAKLQHPHVVGVSDVGTHEGAPFLVMELLAGVDLDHHLDAAGRLDVPETLDLIFPILSALIHVHEAGLVHRDLKPANIFLAKALDGAFHPKLLDFGIAKPGDEEGTGLTATTDVFGTPQYMAPEQVRRSRDATARADQYSMGAVLYRCVTGADAMPLAGSSVFELLERVVSGSFERPSALIPELADSIEPVILRAMARRPEDRFPSIQALGAALLPFANPATKRRWEATFADPASLENTLLPGELRSGAEDRPTVHATAAKSDRAHTPAPSLVVASRDLSGRIVRRRPSGAIAAGALAILALGVYGFMRNDTGPSAGAAGREADATAEPTVAVTPEGPAPTPLAATIEPRPSASAPIPAIAEPTLAPQRSRPRAPSSSSPTSPSSSSSAPRPSATASPTLKPSAYAID